jgi:two-component system nitrogen regulation sensor histidine kinase NtrY
LDARSAEPASFTYNRWTRLFAWAQRARLGRNLALGLTFAAIASGIATYVALTRLPPLGPDPQTLLILLILDLVLLLPLVVLISHRLARLWVERRRGRAGSRLHARLVLLFGLLAVTPAIIVAVFSAVFFNLGIQAWFSDRVGTALRESLSITDAYVAEKFEAARDDLQALADDINRQAIQLMREPLAFPAFVVAQSRERNISGVYAFDGRGRILVDSGMSLSFDRARDLEAVQPQLKDNEVLLLTAGEANVIRAITRLSIYYDSDVYLLMERPLDPALSRHIGQLRRAVDEYVLLEGRRSGIQIGFFALFALVALLLVVAAIWLGFMIANQLVVPIGQLITAAERVGTGDLNVRVPESAQDDELGSLRRSFNRMTAQLARNRQELVEANRQLDARREFTETVLAGVSAGVIGLDAEGRINLPNRSAAELLGAELHDKVGEQLDRVVPEMRELLAAVRASPDRLHHAELQITRQGQQRMLLVRIAADRLRGETVGFVVTFDDITELQAAQRKAAWSDVARRIAHEIKNPLTPIQLSAERLRRKYLGQITGEREAFEICTDTIIRQVGDIGRLVDEFSAFARMPVPVIRNEDLAEICRHAIFLERSAHPQIDYALAASHAPFFVACDGRLVSQALINLLRNSAAAILESPHTLVERRGRIEVQLERSGSHVSLAVSDNGAGLPIELLHRLGEPYVTTRTKGTGLGLAIARKVIEDHGGELRMANPESGGARITMLFPAQAAAPQTALAHGHAAE